MSERGRVLKARDVTVSAAPRPAPRPPVRSENPSRVELVRQDGAVKQVRVFCECGEVHELELLENGPGLTTEIAEGQEVSP